MPLRYEIQYVMKTILMLSEELSKEKLKMSNLLERVLILITTKEQ